MSDKHSDTVAFSDISEITFLKRRFVPKEIIHEGIEHIIVLDPIEPETLVVMLAWTKKSTVSEFAIAADVIGNVKRELLRQPEKVKQEVGEVVRQCVEVLSQSVNTLVILDYTEDSLHQQLLGITNVQFDPLFMVDDPESFGFDTTADQVFTPVTQSGHGVGC